MRNIPYAKGFAPNLWKNITDVEILKKAEVYDINLMRTIQLMNSELNINNKKLGRDLMSRGEKLKLIAREQYGSRKKHQSITAALNKRLTMDLLRQRRQAGALCSNDAKSCYDRVVHSVSSMSMRRLGIPIEPINSMFKCLQQAAHRIRTAFGVSKKKYGDDREIPLQGLGQGNGCGPAGWAIISTPIINMMRVAGFGATFLTAISVSLVVFVCYAFVDDTDVVHTAQDVHTTGEDILLQMQDVIDHWEGGLRATGGAIVPKKSYWYLIDWIYDRGNWRYATQADIPGDLTIRDTCGTKRVTLKRYDPDIAKETLGVFLAMDGNNKEQIIKLRHKTEEFAEQLRTGVINKWDAWYAITATIMKTLEYPMLATTITEKEWDFIMSPIRKSGLPKIQVASNFPSKVLYGPKKFQGMGIMHPFYTQEMSHLALCLYEGENQTITGELLRASMEQLLLELGTPGKLLQLDYSKLENIATDCWIKTVWKFAWENEIEITDTGPQLEPYRWNDQFLMEEFARKGKKGHELKKLNECRMFLEVTNLSEITSADGKKIKATSWKGIKDKNKCNQFQWPRSPEALTTRHWQLWRKAINECFVDPTKLDERVLLMPLGDWEKNVTATWTWFYSEEEDSLYKREGLLWYQFDTARGQRRRRTQERLYERSPTTLREVYTDLLSLADVSEGPDVAILLATCRDPIPPSAIRQPDMSDLTLDSIRNEQHKQDKWAIAEWDCKHETAVRIAEAIQDHTATAISDGSYKNDNGTSAFLVCAEDDSQRIVGVNAVPGSCKEQSAYRSELAGISGILLVLQILCTKFKIHSGSIEIGLDGQQALLAASEDWPLNIAQPDFDLLKDIRAKIQKLPIKVKWHWIKGHQDDDIDYQNLDSWAKNNVQADTMAKLYWNYCEKTGKRLPNQVFSNEGWTYRYNRSKRSRFHKKSIYEELFGDSTCDHWIKKNQIDVAQIHSIDWENCEKAIKRLPFSRQLWLAKHASGHCPVGRMMKIRKHWEHSMCPRCLQDNETTEHVLLCQDPRAAEHFTRLAKKLDLELVSMETAPEIRRTIIRKITNWRRRRRVTAQITNKYGEREASEHQDIIGWTNFMIGRMAPEWAAAQQSYFDWLGRRRTGKRWLVAITVKLLNLSWDMWDHRNKILHASLHPWKLIEVSIADQQIDEEYDRGYINLLRKDYKWLTQPLRTVKKLPIEDKLQWIESVRLARLRFDRDSVAQFQSFQPERNAIAKWMKTSNLPRETDNAS
jgi:ribonuclease HI